MSGQEMPRRGGIRGWLDVRFRSPAAIYGLIVFTAFITIASDETDASGRVVDAAQILEDAVPTLLIFYAAHVFAHTLTDHGERGLGRAVGHAMRHASGMLYASVPSIVILILGTVTRMSGNDAFLWSLLAAVVVLAILGWNAYARRGAGWVARVFGALGTALLGVILIILEYAIH